MFLNIITYSKRKTSIICRYTFLYFFEVTDTIYGKDLRKNQDGGIGVTVNNAVAKRIEQLLKEKGMSQYKLEQKSGIQHGSMQCIMNGRNKTVTLSTVIMLARGFDMSLTDFLSDDIFQSSELEIEQ